MGIDCKGLHTVIHYGPPGTLEDYFQEGWACRTRWFTNKGSGSDIPKELKLKKHLKSSKTIFKK